MNKLLKEFNYIKIKLASPLRVLEWAKRKLPDGQAIGEVHKSGTVNYKTLKPEIGGLFCEQIFGPNKNFECVCGKYKHVYYEGYVCERCGVEITDSRIRRHRMGYIELVYPVTHIWYINSRPNYMSLLLETEHFEKQLNTTYTFYSNTNKTKLTPSTIINLWDERVKRIKLASLAYFITDDEILFYGLHWDLQQYRKSRKLGLSGYPLKPHKKLKKGRVITPSYLLKTTPKWLVGAALIKYELEQLNLKSEVFKTRCFILLCTKVLNKESIISNEFYWFRNWEQHRIYKIREQAIKRVRILENLIGTGAEPSWMILSILPIIPPALRPMLQMEGGRLAVSDLNELYARVIARNNRLSKLLEINAPELIIRNEKRLLQEAVDALIDNSKEEKLSLNMNNKPLKSLSDIIKGKYGRFRQNLLGKRVDYSGRSVIVVGPELKLNQCGLPYKMVTELFQPFIIRTLIDNELAHNVITAQGIIEQNDFTILTPILEEVLSNHPVFLNRAPTLHRLGVQAFEPILVDGKAVKLHPLVCAAFNADFDGDQMAVHIPLSQEAQAECYTLMLAPYNFLSPASGEPIITPSQDMVLGCYYLTVNNVKKLLGSNHYFANFDDVLLAYNQNQINIHSLIWVRCFDINLNQIKPLTIIRLNDKSIIEYYDNIQIRKDKKGKTLVKYLKTTTGRVIFNYTIKQLFNSL